MKANLEQAAIKATETLIKYHVSFAPCLPLPILKVMPRVLVVSFAEMADKLGMERDNILSAFGAENHDAVTNVMHGDGRIRYLVAYNQRLPFYMLQRALARELGHIVLGHDGTRPEEVRFEEAIMFARHFLCPRPLIQSLKDAGIPLTIDVIGNVTGCYERYMIGIRKTPGVHVPAHLNKQVRKQFSDYVRNFADCQSVLESDDSPIVDFGSYMDQYEE